MIPSKLVVMLLAAFALTAIARDARALPQFARKYKMDCSGCHDALAFPRLNDVGYKFRRAGFRMPENIGEDELQDFTLDNYFSAAAEAQNTTDVLRDGGTESLNTFSGGFSVFPLTGSFAKYFASESEIAFEGGEAPEVENAYARAVFGSQDLWLSARAGIVHPLEGLGASDRSLGPSSPLILSAAPNQNQDSLLTPTEPSRVGVDIGGQWKDTSLSIEVFNRARITREGGELAPVGVLPDSSSGKDLMVVANQILGSRSSVSAYWLHGNVALPADPDMFESGASADTFNSRYDRFAAFASAGTSTLLGLAGAQLGFDQALDALTQTKSRYSSIGGFVEGELGVSSHMACYLRMDYFDPSTDISANQIIRGTLGMLAWQPMISVAPELSLQRTAEVTEGRLALFARVIY